MVVPNLLTGEKQKRENPLPPEFKSVLEISTRSPYCIVAGTTILIPPKRDKKTGRVTAGFKTKKIEELIVGDDVAGFNLEDEGFTINKIKELHRRKSETLTIILDNSSKRELCCSIDHPLFTSSGWKMAKDLTISDEVYYYFTRPSMLGENNHAKRPEVRMKIKKSINDKFKNDEDYRNRIKEARNRPEVNEKIRQALRRGEYKVCATCGNKHWVPECLITELNFCSKNCVMTYLKSDRYAQKVTGSGNPNWRGGLSFEPYPEEFNDRLKEKVRDLWGRKCALCDEEENEQKLDVHHLNGDKNDC